jgi:hypothetical protein
MSSPLEIVVRSKSHSEDAVETSLDSSSKRVVVKLNVGGSLFQTTMETLTNQGPFVHVCYSI